VNSHPSTPKDPTATPQAGGRTTTTGNGVASVAPGAATPAASGILPELLTTRQAAELLQVGERTLWRWSRSGLAPKPIKIGRGRQGAVRFSRAALMAWISAGCPRTAGRATP
jgi:excisionase family DNA binding protein